MMAPDYTPLWFWVRERERIRIAKDSGAPPPWTDDPILAAYRFCNVRREDDSGTMWIKVNIRERFAGHEHLWFMLCIARQINWPDTLAELIAAEDAWPSGPLFSPVELATALDARKQRGEKIYTGAYMIGAPPEKGTDKQRYIAEVVLGQLWWARDRFARLFGGTVKPMLREVHARLAGYRGWGPFMAYQAIVDMRFTPLLDHADDVAIWAAAGPGTIRGLNRLHGRKVDAALSQAAALGEMRAIYRRVVDETGVAMDFSDVPNILCETDKYLRVKNGEGKPRARYVPGRGW